MAGWFEAFGNFAKGAQGGFDRYQALRQLDVQNQLKLRQQAMQEEAQKYDNQYRQRQMEQLDQAVLGLKQKSFEDTHSLGNQLSPEDVSTAQGIGLSGLMNKLPQYGDVQNTVLPSSLGRPLVTPTITDMAPTPEDRYIYSGNQAQQQSAQSNAVDQQVKMLNVQKMLADARKTQSEAGINQALMNILNGGQPQQSTGTPSLVPPPSAPSSNNSVPMGGYLAPPEPGNQQTNSLPIPPPLGQAQLPNAPPTSLPNQSKPFGGIDLSPDDIKSIIGKKFFGVDIGKSDPVSTVNIKTADGRIIPFNTRTGQPIELPPGANVYEKPSAAAGQPNLAGNMGLLDRATEAVVTRKMSPSQAVALYAKGMGVASGNFARALTDNIRQQFPDFNFQEAESNYQFGKAPATQNTVRYIDNIQRTIPILQKTVDKLALDNNLKFANAAELYGKKQMSDADYSNFNFLQTAVADEFAKILQGGGTGSATSDAKMKQALEALPGDLSMAQWHELLPLAKDVLSARRGTLTGGTFMEGQEFGATSVPIGTHRVVGGVDHSWTGKRWAAPGEAGYNAPKKGSK